MTTAIDGLHHVTAIASSAQANHDFFTRILGLRLVKKTVNFDDPHTYHLYYGDEQGAPGSIMTYFPWAGAMRGRPGNGETALTQFAVPKGALGFWLDRLARLNVTHLERETSFGETRLVADDPDGLRFALVETEGDDRAPWMSAGIGADVAVRGFHGVSLALADATGTGEILTALMNYDRIGTEAGVTRYRTRGSSKAGIVDIAVDPSLRRALSGAGRVHHVAFATPTVASELDVWAQLVDAGLHVTPPIDRTYFKSLYFRTPGGVLFEIATNEPGFAVDEPGASLGSALKLPPQHEHLRGELALSLPPLAA